MKKGLILKTFVEVRYLRKFRTRVQIERYQRKKIRGQIEFVEKSSPYFSKVTSKNLNDFPFMDKNCMMSNFNKMNTAKIDRDTALSIAINGEKSRDFSEKLEGYSVGLSSGTSGHRGVFVLSDEEIATWVGGMMAKMLPKRKIFGNKVAFFLRADNNLYEASNSKVLQFQFFDIMRPMDENIEKLEAYSPTILVAPPSVLILLAKAIESRQLSINPIRVISVAEVLTEGDEKYFKKVFRQDIIYQVYQCTEGFLGYTCECGSLHINEDVVFVEKEYLDKSRFTPVITDFIRKTQPIIRYRLNDILVEDKTPCKCGSKMLRLKKIEGRMDDVFIFDGRESNGEVTVFPDFIGRVILYVPKIREYKVVQQSKTSVVFYLDNLGIDVRKKIRKEFTELSDRLGFVRPNIIFKTYKPDFSKKMKRIERNFG